MIIIEASFWFSLLALVYVYFGFPVVLLFVSRLNRKPIAKKNILPSVSLIVCAYNEEKHIQTKIQNCLEIDYPREKMEIIFVSDGSTDQTNEILTNHARLKAICSSQRRGKTACQNLAAAVAQNDVLFFTDATTIHPSNALKLLLRGLSDPSVGCVTGRPVFNRDASLTSHGLDMRERYELGLRSKLGEVHTLFGAQDCIYVVPRRLYLPIREDLDSGFVGPLMLLERGYRTVYEPEAHGYVSRAVPTPRDEFIRRSRIVLRGMRGLIFMKGLMNPGRHGFVAISLISTRLLRWLTPVFLLVLFLSNLLLLGSTFFRWVLVLQVGFYLSAVAGYLLERSRVKLGVAFSIPLYFCTLAWAATVGLKRLMAGETGQSWETKR